MNAKILIDVLRTFPNETAMDAHKCAALKKLLTVTPISWQDVAGIVDCFGQYHTRLAAVDLICQVVTFGGPVGSYLTEILNKFENDNNKASALKILCAK